MSEPQAFIAQIDARYRAGFLVAMFLAAAARVFTLEPVPQSLLYHGFADTRSWLGIVNFGDVISSLPFAVTGGIGLLYVLGSPGRGTFVHRADHWPYASFFIGVALVSAGSTYYHLAPDNARLFWDRLPMTIAFMALFSAFIADRVHRRIGIFWLLPVVLCAGLASVVYWDFSESLGRGDLRWYILVQFYPMAALPVICWLFPARRYTSGWYPAWLIGWYAAAKVLEFLDAGIFELLGHTLSGHTLKHLASAIAVLVVIRMIASPAKSASIKTAPRSA